MLVIAASTCSALTPRVLAEFNRTSNANLFLACDLINATKRRCRYAIVSRFGEARKAAE